MAQNSGMDGKAFVQSGKGNFDKGDRTGDTDIRNVVFRSHKIPMRRNQFSHLSVLVESARRHK
jgi:hypothetical protein